MLYNLLKFSLNSVNSRGLFGFISLNFVTAHNISKEFNNVATCCEFNFS